MEGGRKQPGKRSSRRAREERTPRRSQYYTTLQSLHWIWNRGGHWWHSSDQFRSVLGGSQVTVVENLCWLRKEGSKQTLSWYPKEECYSLYIWMVPFDTDLLVAVQVIILGCTLRLLPHLTRSVIKPWKARRECEVNWYCIAVTECKVL